jgi:hypothetical protein
MKLLLLCIFALSAVFAQNIQLTDTVVTKTGISYPCKVIGLNKTNVTIIIQGDLESELKIEALQKLVLGTFGNIIVNKNQFYNSIGAYRSYVYGEN